MPAVGAGGEGGCTYTVGSMRVGPVWLPATERGSGCIGPSATIEDRDRCLLLWRPFSVDTWIELYGMGKWSVLKLCASESVEGNADELDSPSTSGGSVAKSCDIA